jgi:predicted ATP-grasp superfamily ATP-dependent carboligase
VATERLIEAGEREGIARHLARSGSAPALVLDVGWVNGLGAVRSLARAGVRVLALDHRPSALGLRSRYALPLLCPDPTSEEERFAAFLRELVELLPAPAPIFPTHDDGLAAVARAAGSIGGGLLYPFPGWEVLEPLQRKRFQLERAEEAGVAIPATRYPNSAAEARAAVEELGLPLLVKPSEPIGFRKLYRRQAFRCDSAAELDEAYAKAEPFVPMLQEVVPGSDSALYTVGSYLDREGRALGIFCGHKLRQTPPGVGTCRVGETLWLPELVADSLRLLGACGHIGLSQVELKRDERNGAFKLMEINPRLWQWHSLSAACGVNLPLIAYRDLTGDPPAPRTSEGKKKRWAITLLADERIVLPRPPFVEAVFSLRDPKPGFVHLARWGLKRFRALKGTRRSVV